jgi:hypothetical protein
VPHDQSTATAFSQSLRPRPACKFLEAAAAAGMAIRSHNHPLPGRDGETLAMDVALDGPPMPTAADRQQRLPRRGGLLRLGRPGVRCPRRRMARRMPQRRRGVLYIHALNPYGFSHLRRVTHENVDLNRNFQDFTRPLPVNAGLRRAARMLLPEVWPPGRQRSPPSPHFIGRHGLRAYQARSAGPAQPPRRPVLRRHRTHLEQPHAAPGAAPTMAQLRAAHMAWIDLHTGLGPSGLGERIFAGRDDERRSAARPRLVGRRRADAGDLDLRRQRRPRPC